MYYVYVKQKIISQIHTRMYQCVCVWLTFYNANFIGFVIFSRIMFFFFFYDDGRAGGDGGRLMEKNSRLYFILCHKNKYSCCNIENCCAENFFRSLFFFLFIIISIYEPMFCSFMLVVYTCICIVYMYCTFFRY